MAFALPGTVNTVNPFAANNAFNTPGTMQRIAMTGIGATAPKPAAPVAPVIPKPGLVPAAIAPKPPAPAPVRQAQQATLPQVPPAPIVPPATTPTPIPQTPIATPVPYNGQQGLVPPPPPTFPGLVGSLAQTSSQGTPQGQQYMAQLGQTAQGNIPIGQNAQDIANKYAGLINPALKQAQGEEIGNLTGGGLFPVGQGIASQVAGATGQYLQGITSQEAQELAANTQGLTAQQQAQQGLQAAGGLAQTQQQLTQSGLTSAGQLAQPNVAGYGQTSFNPLTQQYGTGGGTQPGGPAAPPIGPQDPLFPAMQTYAQSLANNQGSAIPSFITGNPALQAQLLQMAKEINPNFNYNTATGAGAAQQANAQLAVGGAQQANYQVYGQGLAQQYSIGQQLQNVTNLGNLALENAQGNSVNPFDVRYANQTIAQFRNQLSSTGQATFNSNLASFQAAAGALLATAPGETPSDVTSKIGAIADGSMSLDALKAMLVAAQQEGQIKYQSVAGVTQGSFGQFAGGGAPAPAPSGGGGTYQSASGNSYTLPY